MRGGWLGYLLAAIVCLLIAILVAPLLPYPGDVVVSIFGYIAAVVLLLLAILRLVRGGV